MVKGGEKKHLSSQMLHQINNCDLETLDFVETKKNKLVVHKEYLKSFNYLLHLPSKQ